MLFFVGLLACLALGLGWGRQATWQEATGWDLLPEQERMSAKATERAFEQSSEAPVLRWHGHATIAVEWGELSCVVDPVAAGRLTVTPRRFAQPCVNMTRAYDVILLTHAHMDHLDVATLAGMPASRILLPMGAERFLPESVLNKHRVQPIELGEVVDLGGLEIIPVPAQHGGWRYPWQRGLFACGYVFRRRGESLYVAGDTAMGAHFEEIAAKYAPRTAVLPIGAYAPQWFLRCRHLNPDEALNVAEQMRIQMVVPYHFGTYRVSMESMAAPLLWFSAAARLRGQQWMLPVEQLGE